MEVAFIKLHSLDNIAVVTRDIICGESLVVEDEIILFEGNIKIGNKVALQVIEVGDKIVKYGVPIGSSTCRIDKGAIVHLHNMQSDYIPTYTRGIEFKESTN